MTVASCSLPHMPQKPKTGAVRGKASSALSRVRAPQVAQTARVRRAEELGERSHAKAENTTCGELNTVSPRPSQPRTGRPIGSTTHADPTSARAASVPDRQPPG